MELIPALRDLYADTHPFIVVQKGAQVGISEWMVNNALWAADTGQGGRGNVLYVMPTGGGMHDFSQARVDRAIDESPYLTSRLKPRRANQHSADRTALKRLGDGFIYFRGSDSPRQLAAVDADLVLLDEFDLMGEEVLSLARQRLASSELGWLRVASTPRYPEAGINALFLQSDQRVYHLPCPRCGRRQPLTWPESVDAERLRLVCAKRSCRAPIDVTAEGQWVASAPAHTAIRGYHLSRLYSPLANLEEIVRQSDDSAPAAGQSFSNQVLGEVYVPPGGGLSLRDLDACRAKYDFDNYFGLPCDMGVDVGTKLHVIVRDHLDDKSDRPAFLWCAQEVQSFDDLEPLLVRFNVVACLVDAQPEVHSARAFAARHPNVVSLAYYRDAALGHELAYGGPGEPTQLRISRTEALDQLTQRFKTRRLLLPRSARLLGGRPHDGMAEYYRELIAPHRTFETDAHQNWIARWINGNRPDHYAHAELYAMLAAQARPPIIRWGAVR